MPSTLDTPAESLPTPTSPSQKTVSFDESPSSSSSALPPATTASRPTAKRRRSSLKQGSAMPYRPPKETYSHPDPLIRRLRLRDGYGNEVNLVNEFREAKVVLFFFGATWPGSVREPFDLVSAFARRHPHQCKVVYVSVDSDEASYEANTRQQPWLAMEWNDGSNMSTPLPTPDTPAEPPTPLEPFLLAGDPDLEDEVHHSDPKGELYLRPYSRVYLADTWNVLGVPNLLVYHLPTAKILNHHARFEFLKEGKAEQAWEQWSKGEKIEYGVGDFIYALRWTLGFAVVAVAYMVGVRQGLVPDVVSDVSESLTRNYIFKQQ
ncbi:hypothetical protein JCM10296v2_005102 [Rhodotorula toruloides]